MQLQVQKYLREMRNENWLSSHPYNIVVGKNPEFPEIVILNYHQIDSPKLHPFSMECRGLVLDKSRNWDIVHFPMTRFFNYGEAEETAHELRNGRYIEKMDGSLFGISYYRDQWMHFTRGTIDCTGTLPFNSMTYKELFTKIWNENGYSYPDKYYDMTFEIVDPSNRHVTPYPNGVLGLIALRRKDQDFKECDRDELEWVANKCGFYIPKTFDLSDIKQAIEFVSHTIKDKEEGSVWVSNYRINADRDFYRCKVVNPRHRVWMRAKDEISQSVYGIMQLIILNSYHDFVKEYPEYKDVVFDQASKYMTLVNTEKAFFYKHVNTPTKKELAEIVKGHKLSDWMFRIWDDRYNGRKKRTFEDCLKQDIEKYGIKYVARRFAHILGIV